MLLSQDQTQAGQSNGGLACRVRQLQPTKDCPRVKNGNTSADKSDSPSAVVADGLIGGADEAAGNDRGQDRNLQLVDDSLLVSTGTCDRINY